ncbi:N-acetyltransferase 16, like [Denticeps clupeoides]|uniref:N-acetyltransferase domain-containing protein n=1 Tax=Denticeps clupeoides TaxID=299321 RepID=A0AAY4AKD5_9TELE|nr:probable N-acetyltransferase 16 [Denticeps clupeoides]
MAADFLGESDGLTLWLAKPEDYADVMAISENIYDGNDYLPHRYWEWMTEPDRVVFLARRDRKLVAFESGFVVDKGCTLILEGLRVCPSERGRGIAGIIQRFSDMHMKKLYPSIRVKRLTRADVPGREKLSKFKLLARRAVLSFCGEAAIFGTFVSALKTKLAAEGDTGNKMFTFETEDHLKAVILDPDLTCRLQLPGGAIIQDWQPLQPMESNLEVLRRRNLKWFLAGPSKTPTFLSFHTPPYPVPFNGGALRLNVDLYGTDPALARPALVAHLENVAGKIDRMVLVHVYMHPSVWEELWRLCQVESGLTQYRDYWEQVFLEKEME